MRRWIPLGVSLVLIAAIYALVDVRTLVGALVSSDPAAITAAFVLFIPIIGLSAWRLQRLAPREAALGLGEAVRLTLAAGTLNMVLPSKMGDLAKGIVLWRRGDMDGGRAMAMVVFERGADLLALLALCLFGLLLYRRWDGMFLSLGIMVGAAFIGLLLFFGSRTVAAAGFRIAARLLPPTLRESLATFEAGWWAMRRFILRPGLLTTIACASLVLWLLNLAQIWLFALALGAAVPVADHLAIAPLAIFAGLLPLTLAGIGTRDAALIGLYLPYMVPATGAALGVLCTVRYLLPAIAGLLFIGRYLEKIRQPQA